MGQKISKYISQGEPPIEAKLKLKDHEILCITIVLTTIAVLLFIGLSAAVILRPSKSMLEITWCNSTLCHEAALFLKKSMDHKVDPCTDFYSFACGKWIERFSKMPANAQVWSVKDVLRGKVEHDLQENLKNAKVVHSSQAVENAKTFYQMCIKSAGSSKDSDINPLKDILSELGGCPLIETHTDVTTDFSTTTGGATSSTATKGSTATDKTNPDVTTDSTSEDNSSTTEGSTTTGHATSSTTAEGSTATDETSPDVTTESTSLTTTEDDDANSPTTTENDDANSSTATKGSTEDDSDSREDNDNNDTDSRDESDTHIDNREDSRNFSVISWTERIGKMKRMFAQDSIILFSVEKYQDEYCIHLSQGTFGINIDSLSKADEAAISSYKRSMETAFTILRKNDTRGISTAVEAMVDFETSLAKIAVPAGTPIETTLTDLQTKYPKIKLIPFIKEVFGGPDVELTMSAKVIVNNGHYFEKLGELMQVAEERTVANYLSWRLIQKVHVAPLINSLDCLRLVSDFYNEALVRLFSFRYFSKHATNQVTDMTSVIVWEIQSNVFRMDWLEIEAKNLSHDKLAVLKTYVGFPLWIFSDKFLDAYYDAAKLPAKHYYSALRISAQNLAKRVLRKLKRSGKNQIWNVFPLEMEHHYFANENKLSIVPYLLQIPYFHEGIPMSMSYGGIGFIIASEVYAALTGDGLNYDKNGNKTDWFPKISAEKYNEKSECYVYQYSAAVDVLANMQLNGNKTLDQNIADNGGVRAAYEVFTTRMVKDERLSGFKKFTSNHLFFIAFAVSHCTKTTKEGMKKFIKESKTTPALHRINLVLANMPEFSEIFQCKEGTAMNPIKKCEVW